MGYNIQFFQKRVVRRICHESKLCEARSGVRVRHARIFMAKQTRVPSLDYWHCKVHLWVISVARLRCS